MAEPGAGASEPFDVLVVDDQPMIVEAVRRALAAEPAARLHGCLRASDALAQARALRPAVILQDLNLGDGDGLALITLYRSDPLLAECSIVVLSSTEDPLVKARAFAAGAADYIEKLPPPVEFVARVRHHALASRALVARNRAMRALEEKDAELQRRNAMLDEANARLKHANQELVVDVREQRQKVEALAAAGGGLASIQDLDVLLQTILTEAAGFAGAKSGALFVVEGNTLRAAAHYADGAARPTARGVASTPVDAATIVGEVAATASTRRSNGEMNLSRPLAADGVLHASGRSYLVLPVSRNAVVLGVLALADAEDADGFSEEDDRLLRNFANLAAVALERAQAARSLIFRMVSMAALRDPTETAGHVQRVAGIAEVLFESWAAERGLPAEQCSRQRDLLRIAAILHDVGKVGIADAILKKAGQLDPVERASMERHTEIGSELFAGLRSDLDECAAEVALCHHEKWDGTGYPRSLQGEAIPLFARIVAVADVYDALASPRAYKEPWSRDRILALFNEETGRHFDPDFARLLCAKIEDVERVRDTFADETDETP